MIKIPGAPPLKNFHLYPITSFVMAAAMAVTGLSFAGVDVSVLYFDVRASFMPWRLVTSILPHVDVLHLAFNLCWFWLFGTILEHTLGRLKYVLVLRDDESDPESGAGGRGAAQASRRGLLQRVLRSARTTCA